MATIQSPFLGEIRGKFAGAVFYVRYGKTFMRSKPLKVKNPKTPGQLKQRMKFSLVHKQDKYLRTYTRKGFPEATDKMSQYNAFMKANIRNAVTGNYPDLMIDFPKLVVSGGSLNGAEGARVKAMPEKQILQWHCLSTLRKAQ